MRKTKVGLRQLYLKYTMQLTILIYKLRADVSSLVPAVRRAHMPFHSYQRHAATSLHKNVAASAGAVLSPARNLKLCGVVSSVAAAHNN